MIHGNSTYVLVNGEFGGAYDDNNKKIDPNAYYSVKCFFHDDDHNSTTPERIKGIYVSKKATN